MSIHNQLHVVMQNAVAFGQSKRSYRAQTGSAKVDRIFSKRTYGSILETSRHFGNYLQERGITRLDQVTRELVQEYLDLRAETCNLNTLVKIRSHIESLGLFAHAKWKSVNPENFKPNHMPESLLPNGVKTGRPMPADEYLKLVGYAKEQGKTGKKVADALEIVRHTGMRIEEVCSQEVSDVHIDERGKFGFGYVEVSNPKHGRKRTIHLHSSAGRAALQKCVDEAKGETLLKTSPKTMQNALAQYKRLSGINLGQRGFHSVRKLYAQSFYDWYRTKHTKRETIQMTNMQLGHGKFRSVSELKTYVINIW